MKLLPFVASIALALPLSAAASVAMGAQQTGRSGGIALPTPAGVSAHRPVFIVKYVLRRPAPEAPKIAMGDNEPQIVPPGSDFPASKLGAMERDPNKLICSSWGCQRRP